MPLTPLQTLATIFAVALGTVITRFTPFLLFPETKKQPKAVIRLGRTLPPAMMGLLVIYCLKGVSLTEAPYGLPELIAIFVTAALQLWRKNALLSIFAGTAAYILLLQRLL